MSINVPPNVTIPYVTVVNPDLVRKLSKEASCGTNIAYKALKEYDNDYELAFRAALLGR